MTAKLAHRNAELEHEMCERRHVEQTLHDRQAALHTLTQAVPGILSTFLPDGRCEYFSQRFYDYTGLSPEDGAGEGWIRAIHPDDRGGTLDAWRTCVEKGKPFEREYRLSSAVGAARWFLTRIVPQVDAHGRIVRWHGVSVDVTEQKDAEAMLQAVNHDLEERVGERTAALTEANCRLTREISEHRDASERLSYIQQQLLAITSQAPVGIFLADWQGDWEFANEWWRETTGLTVDETKGSGWLRVVHPADRDRLCQHRCYKS